MTFIPKNTELSGTPCGVLCFMCTCEEGRIKTKEMGNLLNHDPSKPIGKFVESSDNDLTVIEYNDRGVQFLKDIGVIKEISITENGWQFGYDIPS